MPSKQVRANRSKVKINPASHVVVVNRSNKNVVAQVVEPVTHKVLATVSSAKVAKGTKLEKSAVVGSEIAKVLSKIKPASVVFNRNGHLYHGRIKAIADAIRDNGVNI